MDQITKTVQELDFYTLWRGRFSDTDDLEQQQKEVNAVFSNPQCLDFKSIKNDRNPNPT